MQKKILITGANSPVTIDVIKLLKKKNVSIYASVKNKKKIINKLSGINYIEIDLKTKFNLPDIKFDYLIHFAAATPYKKYKFKEYEKINVQGFKILLKSITSLKKVVLLSTTDVLDLFNIRGIKKLKRDNKLEYSKSKYKMENILKKFSTNHKTKSLILRCPAIMCKTNNDINFIQKIVHNHLKTKDITIYNPYTKYNNLIDTLTIYETIFSFLNKNIIYKNFITISLAPKDSINMKSFFALLNKKKKLKFNFIYKNKKSKITKIIKTSNNKTFKLKFPLIKDIIKKI